MEGFDYERARTELKIPEAFEVEAMAAVGKPGAKEMLPEKLRAKTKALTTAEKSAQASAKARFSF